MTSGGNTRIGGSGAGTGEQPQREAVASAPADGAEASLIGEVLDNRYKILKKLGEGGMGEVYAAEHIHIEKKVAIKLLRPEIVSNQEAVSRFRQEARSASSIGHRNIIGIDDFGQLKDGRIYLCMELLDGAPLNDMIKEPISADRLLNILIQTGHGLAAAHAKGIIHRDMKPENIFVTTVNGEDVPKLLDFGIAKVAGQDGQNNLTRTGTIFGTPFYMAPEQALGQGVDARVDIYALGVIAYEVFSGSLPFQGESFMGILTQHITTEPEPVAQRAAKAGRSLPPGLAEVIVRAMAKDPDKRYRSMDELVNALVGVYRSMAGAGMSSYMEAFSSPPRASGPHGSTPVPSGMMPGASGPVGQLPTLAAGAPSQQPYSTGAMPPTIVGPMGPAGLGGPGGPGGPGGGPTPAPLPQLPLYGNGPPSQPMQPYGNGAPNQPMQPYGYGNSDSSQFGMDAPPKKSKTGLIAAIVIVLLLGVGITAVVVLTGAKDKDQANGGEVAATNDAGAVAIATPDAAGAIAIVDDVDAGSGSGSGSGLAPLTNVDAGAVEPAVEIDAGVAAVEIDAGVVDEPAGTDIVVLVKSPTRNATIFVDGVAVGKAPKIVKVTPGQTYEVTVKAKGYEDKTITVDGTEDDISVKLKSVPGIKPPKIDCTKEENALKSECLG